MPNILYWGTRSAPKVRYKAASANRVAAFDPDTQANFAYYVFLRISQNCNVFCRSRCFQRAEVHHTKKVQPYLSCLSLSHLSGFEIAIVEHGVDVFQ